MNPWQPPDPKRFRPNEANGNHRWAPPPPHQGPPVHPSRQSQLPPPPPPIAPYHQTPANPPYYNGPPPPQMHAPPPHHYPPPHPSRRSKTSDPRQRHREHPSMYPVPHHPHHVMPPSSPPINHMATSSNRVQNDSELEVLHIASDESKNFGPFAVTLSQIYGSRNVDGLPFGSLSSNSIEFDGRIALSPILAFLPEAIDTPSKKVRVYELAPLAASDKKSYDELLSFFTKHERCPVVDKEYNMGILLYFVPPKLIFKRVEPTKINDKDKRNKNKKKRMNSKNENKAKKTNFCELLKLNAQNVSNDRLWMISITSTSKYLMFKQKRKDKQNGMANDKRNGKKKDDDLSDIEISSDEDDGDESGNEKRGKESDEDEEGQKGKENDVIKSELIVSLENLYNAIGQKLP